MGAALLRRRSGENRWVLRPAWQELLDPVEGGVRRAVGAARRPAALSRQRSAGRGSVRTRALRGTSSTHRSRRWRAAPGASTLPRPRGGASGRRSVPSGREPGAGTPLRSRRWRWDSPPRDSGRIADRVRTSAGSPRTYRPACGCPSTSPRRSPHAASRTPPGGPCPRECPAPAATPSTPPGLENPEVEDRGPVPPCEPNIGPGRGQRTPRERAEWDAQYRRHRRNQGTDNIRVESTTGAVVVGGGGSRSRRLSPMPVPHSSP